MDCEILNNIGENFLQKIPIKSSVCREYCGQSEIHHTKLKEFFVPKRPIYENLSHFFTIISEWEIHAHIYRLFFRLCKTLFYTYFYRAYCAQRERNFRKLKEVYVLKRNIYKSLSHFSNSYYGFGIIKQCWKALFAENTN